MQKEQQKNFFIIEATEEGQKLLHCLIRRLGLSKSLVHRWVRTGQIRLNGKRTQPFERITMGDIIRLPPFALPMAGSVDNTPTSEKHCIKNIAILPLPPLLYEHPHLLVFNKPLGMPIHTGTGHSDSLATRLKQHFYDVPFCPTPAHRLDKDTSGIVLVARSYTALRALQEALQQGTLCKEYLAWVHGIWTHEKVRLLEHHIDKAYTGCIEKVHTLPEEQGKIARCLVQCIQHTKQHSLMHIRLLTGRTHQIRVQMAAEGHPLLGDTKYGGQNIQNGQKLHLHALRISMPHTKIFEELDLANCSIAVLPTWKREQAINTLPLAYQNTDE